MIDKDALILELLKIKCKDKFGQNRVLFYSGVSYFTLKIELNKLINKSIDDFILNIKNGAAKIDFLKLIEIGVNQFNSFNLDTEDREQVCLYYEEIMEVVNLESSDGILNKWMYGFDF
ncbi:DUF4844 domain-containing protein [Flavobacterium tructae]|uniref:DUF4844 domain-containing protein n=1 Tax=Flavobacterium tructae TaxID=1114873 RepID=UPI002551D91D|nr:DUF4844 domain-containing protein [Flavobacterium tructae]MDL2141715.1 DUF4844 domain-containing protein [Flavobacterium tructae]